MKDKITLITRHEFLRTRAENRQKTREEWGRLGKPDNFFAMPTGDDIRCNLCNLEIITNLIRIFDDFGVLCQLCADPDSVTEDDEVTICQYCGTTGDGSPCASCFEDGKGQGMF